MLPVSTYISPSSCCIDEFDFLAFETEQDQLYYSIWEQESREASNQQMQNDQIAEQVHTRRTTTQTNKRRRFVRTANNNNKRSRTITSLSPTRVQHQIKRLRASNVQPTLATRPSSIDKKNDNAIINSSNKNKVTHNASISDRDIYKCQHHQDINESINIKVTRIHSTRQSLKQISPTTKTTKNLINNNRNHVTQGRRAVHDIETTAIHKSEICAHSVRALKQMPKSYKHHHRVHSRTKGDNNVDSRKNIKAKKMIKRKVINRSSLLDDNSSGNKSIMELRILNRLDGEEVQDDDDIEIDQMEQEIRSILADQTRTKQTVNKINSGTHQVVSNNASPYITLCPTDSRPTLT